MYIHLGISERLTHQLKIASLWVSKVSHSCPRDDWKNISNGCRWNTLFSSPARRWTPLFLVRTTHFGIRMFEVSQVWSIELGSISNHNCKWLFHISHPLKVFHDVSVSQISVIWTLRYPLVNFHITMERSTIFQWVNPLFLWPFYHFQWVNPLFLWPFFTIFNG